MLVGVIMSMVVTIMIVIVTVIIVAVIAVAVITVAVTVITVAVTMITVAVTMITVAVTVAMSVSTMTVNLSLEGGIGHKRHVLDTILGVELGKKVVGSRVREHLRDLALRIVQIPEHDRTSRAGLFAGTPNGTVWNRPVLSGGPTTGLSPFVLVLDLGLGDALRAQRAFLHHTTTSHGDFRVELHSTEIAGTVLGVVTRLDREESFLLPDRFTSLIVEPVESSNLVRAVVAAVSGSDATVVDHHVQTIVVVNGRCDRTDLFTRRVFAVKTAHGLSDDLLGV